MNETELSSQRNGKSLLQIPIRRIGVIRLSQPTVSLVIPVGPLHERFVAPILKNLARSQIAPFEVILAPSSPLPNFSSKFRGLNISVLDPVPNSSAAANRNRGWDIAKGTYVSFCDVDDWYSPLRIGTMAGAMESHDADVGYHSYRNLRIRGGMRKNPNFLPVASPEEMARLNPSPQASLVDTEQGSNNPRFPTLGGVSSASLGHVTVRSQLTLRFPLIPHGEDGWLASFALITGLRVIYVARALSIYNPLNYENAKDTFKSTLKHKAKEILALRNRT